MNTKEVKIPKESWLRKDGAFEPIVPLALWCQAQGELRARAEMHTMEEALRRLRNLYLQHGFLTTKLMHDAKGMAHDRTYARWFGSIYNAYRAVGYEPPSSTAFIETRLFLNKLRHTLFARLMAGFANRGDDVSIDLHSRIICVNDKWTIGVAIATSNAVSLARMLWGDASRKFPTPDFTIAVRMAIGNREIREYFFVSKDLMDNRRSGTLRFCKLAPNRINSLEDIFVSLPDVMK